MQRFGSVVKVRPEKLEEYRRLHAAAWPAVLESLRRHHVRNFTIFHRDGYLFSYLEYTGEDFDADNERMMADPVVREWDRVCNACQVRVDGLPPGKSGESWLGMEELFHLD